MAVMIMWPTAGMTVTWAAEKITTDQEESGTEDTPLEEKVIEDITLDMESESLVIKNVTEQNFDDVEYKKKEAEKQTENQESEDQSSQSEDAEDVWNLVMTDEAGEEHIFEDVHPDQWKEPSLTVEYGLYYINYTDINGKQQEIPETAEETEFDEPITVYATTEVNVREGASTQTTSLKVASLASEWKAVAAVPGWIKVENGEISGYIFHIYVTEDKEKVDALVQERAEAARKAAEAAKKAAEEEASRKAAAEAAAATENSEQEAAIEVVTEESEVVYEVTRQAYDDEDGSGHGYYEITYSDGSISYENY
jgi:hypothetical protein